MTMTIKQAARSEVEGAADALVDLSHRIWDHPELAFEEERASAWSAEALADAGFSVETGVADLPTAFVAEAGSGPLVIGICAELDALPGIGHACGHNMIAAAGVGAGLALARVADDLGITVRVLGTPAEELGGGKILMVEQGVFDGIHLAMMVHPAPVEGDAFPTLAISQCDFHYHGKTAHASLAPNLGINAADAITVAQVGVGLLRQHLEVGDQVHGIVTRGGEAANIVPSSAASKPGPPQPGPASTSSRSVRRTPNSTTTTRSPTCTGPTRRRSVGRWAPGRRPRPHRPTWPISAC